MTRKHAYFTAAAAVAVLALGVPALFDRAPDWQARPGSAKRIVVAAFSVSTPIDGWSPQVFAESLAVHLNANPAVDARVGGEMAAQADFSLEGEVVMKDGRVVIALRLVPAGQRAATWSATFWRDGLADAKLATDLAERVAEALGVGSTRPDSSSRMRDSASRSMEKKP